MQAASSWLNAEGRFEVLSRYLVIVTINAPRSAHEETQRNLRAGFKWSGDADLPLNAAKCVHLPIGRAPHANFSLSDGTSISIAESSKDLGIIVTSSFKTSNHCEEASSRRVSMDSTAARTPFSLCYTGRAPSPSGTLACPSCPRESTHLSRYSYSKFGWHSLTFMATTLFVAIAGRGTANPQLLFHNKLRNEVSWLEKIKAYLKCGYNLPADAIDSHAPGGGLWLAQVASRSAMLIGAARLCVSFWDFSMPVMSA